MSKCNQFPFINSVLLIFTFILHVYTYIHVARGWFVHEITVGLKALLLSISARGSKFSPKRIIHHLMYISAFDRVLLLSFANTSFGVNNTVALGYHGNPST